jgi:hypothetical protein
MTLDENVLRSWWWTRQGLDGSLEGAPAAEVLSKTGWIRSVGGAAPYLGLHARAGLGRAAVDEACARLEIHELPSARGCTYVLPAADFALGLAAGQGDEAELAMARKYLGVTDAEVARLRAAVVEALGAGPLDPRGLKDALGERVRNLGAEGKKRGLGTTLPLALGSLQAQGRIRRVAVDGRLDRQRYAYARWEPGPLEGAVPAPAEAHVELGRRFFRWAGPATLAQFAAFAGIGVKDSRVAAASLGLVPLADGDARHMLPEDLEALARHRPSPIPRYRFVSNLDGLLLFRRELAPLLGAADQARNLWTEKGPQAGGALMDLSNQAVVDRGRIVGLWDWDGVNGRLAWTSFAPPDAALTAEAERMAAWIDAELGDVRSFSLDSPESRGSRLAALRAG